MRLSSIFDSEGFQVRIRLSLVMLIPALSVLLAEFVLRIPSVTGALPKPEPTLWYNPGIQVKLDYLKEFQKTNGIDVLFVGHSAVESGIDPEVFDAESQRLDHGSAGAFNGSITAAPPFGVHLFLEIYLQYSTPTTIIYGLLPGDLNFNNQLAQEITDRLKRSEIAQAEAGRGLKGDLFRRVFQWSQLFRYRFVLLQLLLRGGQFEVETVDFNNRGFRPELMSLTNIPLEARRTRMSQTPSHLLNYSMSGEQTDALVKIMRLCQQKSIRLILVNMPVARGYLGRFSSERYRSYLAKVSSLSEEYQSQFWDLHTIPASCALGDSDFRDFHHLNQGGAVKLSKILAQLFDGCVEGSFDSALCKPQIGMTEDERGSIGLEQKGVARRDGGRGAPESVRPALGNVKTTR